MNSKIRTKYSFPSGKFFLKFGTVVITGCGRSGKTTLAKVLTTNKNIEYSEEPWLLNLLPVMVKLKVIDKEIGKDMFVSYLHELMNEVVLLRQVNFRPNEDSSIWTKKTKKEIAFRLKKLQSRLDVKNFVKKNNLLFLLVLREAPLFNPSALFDFLPDLKIIHVVSKGLDNAKRIEDKKWLSDENLMRPPHARIYYSVNYKGKVFYVPSWINPKEAKKFLGYSEYERALLYWCSLMENSLDAFKKFKRKGKCLTIKFEDFVKSPQKIVKKANSFLKTKPSFLTNKALVRVKADLKSVNKIPKLPKELIDRTKKLYKKLGYEWI